MLVRLRRTGASAPCTETQGFRLAAIGIKIAKEHQYIPSGCGNEYRDQMVALIKSHLQGIQNSPFMRHMFNDEFLRNLDKNPSLNAKDLFKIYSFWRFGELYRL